MLRWGFDEIFATDGECPRKQWIKFWFKFRFFR